MTSIKYVVDINSKEYEQGYSDFMCGRDTYYSRKTDYQKYKNHKAGYNKAKEDVEILGKEKAYNEWRMRKIQFAIGKPEQEVREILRLPDGNVIRDEFDAVMIYLYSTSESFNKGRDAYLNGMTTNHNPFSIGVHYADHINWLGGFDTTKLAVRLHGRQKVIENL